MTRLRVATFCIAAMAVVMASTASSALALKWLTNGTTLFSKAIKEGPIEAKAETAFTLTSTLNGGAKVVILCKTVKFTLGKIKESVANMPTDNVSAIAFGECKVDEPLACKVSASITTAELSSVLFEEGFEGSKEVWDLFQRSAGTEWAAITISGSECAGEGIYKLTGTACTKVLTPNTDSEILLWEFGVPLPECALKLGVNAATLAGIVEIRATSSVTWGADVP